MTPLPLYSRFLLAWAAFFRILFDGMFAARVNAASEARAELPPAAEAQRPVLPEAPPAGPALQLLALLQREGRLVDFLEQDVTGFSDADVGAAARVVHEGCRKALHAHASLAPVRTEEEGATVTIPEGFDPSAVKLVGNVTGSGPFKGKLVHKGWRADGLSLPVALADHDVNILAPAEVEL
jgi:hypothetical protein